MSPPPSRPSAHNLTRTTENPQPVLTHLHSYLFPLTCIIIIILVKVYLFGCPGS